ncbi:MAG: hypothetical protein ACD_34C00503G0001 [uncultured bacterium]|nr:MAG: hypothetical protein ACD_34C00503G0001 [uncultured bacterium]
MSYQEKKTLASITSGALLLAAYCLYAFNPARSPADLKGWATTMLIFIAIGIGATIIIQIVFHILFSIGVAIQGKIQNRECDDKDIEKNIKLEMVEDERDRMIEMKSNQVGFGIAGFGFIAALLALVLNYSPVVMLNILFLTFCFGSICEGIFQFILYRRGYSHA